MALSGCGRLDWFDFTAGYGYVLGDDGAKYIVHRRSLRRGYLPHIGDALAFTVKDVAAGKLAVDARLQEPREDGEPDDPIVTAPADVAAASTDPAPAADVPDESPAVDTPSEARPASPPRPDVPGKGPGATAPNGITPAPTPRPGSGPGPAARRFPSQATTDNFLAQALAFQKMGNEKKARYYFERGMTESPSSQLITA